MKPKRNYKSSLRFLSYVLDPARPPRRLLKDIAIVFVSYVRAAAAAASSVDGGAGG